MSFIQINGRNAANMEVIGDNGLTRLCKKSSSIYPLRVSKAAAAYTGGRILSCGGGYPYTDQCFIYEKGKGWSKLSKMKQPRAWSASIPIDGGMIVTGGFPQSSG